MPQLQAWLSVPLLLLLWTTITTTNICVSAAGTQSSLQPNDDPYQILGVSRQAPVADIKKAYRALARSTHPDKQPDKDPEQAAAEFRRVVDAWEILSDDDSRRAYDRTGRTDGGNGGFGRNQQAWQQQQQHRSQYHQSGTTWTFTFRNGRLYRTPQQQQPRRLKDDPKVREAQSRVMHVVSLAQLQTILLDEDDLTERSLLMCFVTPGDVERMAEDELVFPYPFAGMSTQKIWWEDLLQTVQVKFHRGSELSRFFQVPSGEEINASGKPFFVFVDKGKPLSDFATFSTSNRKDMESWVWKQMHVEVTFVNQHEHPVELYWIHGGKGNHLVTLQPGDVRVENTMLSHEFYARDDRVDRWDGSPGRHKLSKNSAMGSWKILSDPVSEVDGNTIYIRSNCFDLSGHCEWWAAAPRHECQRNPGFMNKTCQKTCEVCAIEHKSGDSSSRNGDEL